MIILLLHHFKHCRRLRSEFLLWLGILSDVPKQPVGFRFGKLILTRNLSGSFSHCGIKKIFPEKYLEKVNVDTYQDAYLNQIMLKIPKPQSVKQNLLPKKKQFVLKSDKRSY